MRKQTENRLRIAAAVLILSAGLNQSVYAQENLLCGEDELVFLEGQTSYMYDCHGNKLGSESFSVENEIFAPLTMKKGDLMLAKRDQRKLVYEVNDTLRLVCEFPDSYIVTTNQNYIGVYDIDLDEVRLINSAGEILYEGNAVFHNTWDSFFLSPSENGCYMKYLISEEEADVSIEDINIENSARRYGKIVWISKDGTRVKDIAEESIGMNDEMEKLHILGDYALNGETLYDTEGNIYEYDISNYSCEPNQYRINPKVTAYIRNNEDGTRTVFDKDLQQHESNPESRTQSSSQVRIFTGLQHNQDWSGAGAPTDGEHFQGIETEHLDGCKVDGWIYQCYTMQNPVVPYYNNAKETAYPYADFETEMILYKDGKTMHLPHEVGESVETLNEYVYLTHKDDVYFLRSMGTECGCTAEKGEILWRSEKGLGQWYIFLGSRMLHAGEDEYYLIDEQGNLHRSDAVDGVQSLSLWSQDYMIGYRGAYKGILDPEGNWIIKEYKPTRNYEN